MQTQAAEVGRENVSAALKTISPKPIITRVVQSWRVTPGMIFAVAEDAHGSIWIVESTPVGTQCWTVEQAMELPQGMRTRRALREAIRLGCRLQEEYAALVARSKMEETLKLPDMLPHYAADIASISVSEVAANKTETEVETGVAQQRPRLARRRQVKETVCV